ncbi:MerR family transcriptional regulator [Ketogulonicigenium robustum]|uniref:MerR family transcriptional regulator n=1 Tax=Ketogulonicigenium robustum TaxID=92947 RepID=A0A1W6NYP8_9RHOB|nr:helix-turn-helix domain-containing protein [Ketogulonicigenium robustum]ARO14147.1 MerR family transcriptional regulator [Ketogulonicigenium robustum]
MLTIGKLGKSAGVKVPTIRYYEQIGLLPDVGRSSGNQRLYDENVLQRLRFIRHARDLGFPLDAVRELLSLSDQPDHSCAAVDEIAVRQLHEVRARISRLQALEAELSRMIAADQPGNVAQCHVIEVLGNHDLCAHHDHGDAA